MVTAIEVIVNSSIIVSFDVALIIVKNHNSLENLDYEHSGHTGFASSADLVGKQDKLTAGDGITINENNVISSSGGGSSDIGFIYLTSSSGTIPEADRPKLDKPVCFLIITVSGTTKCLKKVSEDSNAYRFECSYDVYRYLCANNSSTMVYTTTVYKSSYSYTNDVGTYVGENKAACVIETGALVKKRYSDLSPYKVIFCYGYRDGLAAPNQFSFFFFPDQLNTDQEDFEVYAIAGPSNWEYPIKVKRSSDGFVYWWSAYDYSGNTTFYVTKIVGIK